MRRIKDSKGVVHYACPADGYKTLCGCDAFYMERLLASPPERVPWLETTDRVTCKGCAKVVCAIRNEPYNTLVADISDAAFMRGIYAAVEPDGAVAEKDGEEK